MPQGGLTEDQQARGSRARARRTRSLPGPAAAGRRRRRRTRSCCRSWSTRWAVPTWRRTCRCWRRSWPYRGEDRRAPGWRLAEVAPDVDFRVVIIGAGMSGLLVAHRLATSRHCVRRPREEPRRRRHVAREPLSRAAGSTTPTTTTATRSHSATTGRSTSPRRTFCSITSAACADAFELRDQHPVQHRGPVGHMVRDRHALDLRVRASDGSEGSLEANAVVSAVGQLNRPSLPAIVGPRQLRRTGLPLGALGRCGRSPRQARRGHRYRRERGAVHSRDRAGRRRALGLPAHTAMVRAYARLSRRGVSRAALALWSRSVLQRVEPLLDLLEDGRRRAGQRARGRGVGAEGPSRQRDERLRSAHAGRVHQGRIRRPPRPTAGGDAQLSTGRQADAPGQRCVGRRAEAGQRPAAH